MIGESCGLADLGRVIGESFVFLVVLSDLGSSSSEEEEDILDDLDLALADTCRGERDLLLMDSTPGDLMSAGDLIEGGDLICFGDLFFNSGELE